MFFKQMIIKNVNKIAVNIGEAYNSPWGKSKSFGDLIGLTITGALTKGKECRDNGCRWIYNCYECILGNSSYRNYFRG